jgi:hypothetical protein
MDLEEDISLTSQPPSTAFVMRLLGFTIRTRTIQEGTEMNLFKDKLLRASLVVETAGEWFLVPRTKDGWQRRLPLKLTEAARTERLTPAKGVDPTWLGIVEAEAAI